MYSCSSGNCLVNEASMRRPRTANVSSSAVTSANRTTMMARWPKIRRSRANAMRDSDLPVAIPDMLTTRILARTAAGTKDNGAHAAFTGHHHRTRRTRQQCRNAFAVVLLSEAEGLARIPGNQQHSREPADNHAQIVDGHAVGQHGAGM